MSNLADRLFNFDAKKKTIDRAKEELAERFRAAGIPFVSLGWDHYDCSVEIHGVPPDYRLSEDAQRAIHQAGFGKAYVNHTDKWETHYNFNRDFALSKGWRVSYPHKRGEGESGIWVEEVVDGWPEKWFKTGYCLVKSTNAVSQGD